MASIRDLLPEVERRTGRTVSLQSAEVGWSAPCGMWVATERTHYVFYDPMTSRAHQDHIIAHEFAHILMGHKGAMEVPDETVGGLLTLLDPELIKMVLGRTQYEDQEELEAELTGSYLHAHIRSTRNHARPSDDPEADRVARTLLRKKVVSS
ncbi:hypothetical protein [Streptomyces sp. NPDC037389]|uniref:hypothetical protein n=1 Tax=Streptomyces sp. NPDC037389 TaxID=3155369 RepID=UPI0033E0D693